jgi:hypothetical protein
MSALEDSTQPANATRTTTRHAQALVLVTLAISLLLGAAAFLVAGVAGGWSAAADLVSRFSVLIFVAALSGEPLAKLFPHLALRAVAREQDGLMFAFIAAFAVSLFCVLIPFAGGLEPFTLPALVYCALNGAILVVMYLSYHPSLVRQMSPPSWRAIRRVATGYFWLAFTLWSVGRLRASQQPDAWYAFSLAVLLAVPLLRLVRSVVVRQRARESVKIM